MTPGTMRGNAQKIVKHPRRMLVSRRGSTYGAPSLRSVANDVRARPARVWTMRRQATSVQLSPQRRVSIRIKMAGRMKSSVGPDTVNVPWYGAAMRGFSGFSIIRCRTVSATLGRIHSQIKTCISAGCFRKNVQLEPMREKTLGKGDRVHEIVRCVRWVRLAYVPYKPYLPDLPYF